MKRTEAGGIKKAQDPIMIGKATCGDMPKAKTKAIQGAYKPIPAVIKAPNPKLAITAMANLPPVSPIASPPPCIHSILLANIKKAVTSKAKPMTRRIFRSDSFATTPAPSTAPSAADKNIRIKVTVSTSIMVIKMSA